MAVIGHERPVAAGESGISTFEVSGVPQASPLERRLGILAEQRK